ncbi:MAG TPA: cytochrome b/b6 domain-containing protein [Anaerolineales bacterium]|nr:cytochrome b/b6 domain-containing protein [Anaerolineales bacterium]
MKNQSVPTTSSPTPPVKLVRTIPRFSASQRAEHAILLLCVAILLITGLPQKYNASAWSQAIISSPSRLNTIQQIHHITALVLTALVLYHLGKAIYQMARRKLSGEMLPTFQDIKDAGNMLLYLVYIKKQKPAFGKYNFEQKVTYWFLFFSLGIMLISGFIMWFPEVITRIFPGGVIPAAIMAHSTEAIVTLIFIVLWHFYHVHLERLNLSIFSGWLNDEDMRTYHALEYDRLLGMSHSELKSGEEKS